VTYQSSNALFKTLKEYLAVCVLQHHLAFKKKAMSLSFCIALNTASEHQ
jgi:hypothetical protein